MHAAPKDPRHERGDSTEIPTRRHPRYAPRGLRGRMAFATQAKVVDLSLGGIGLETLDRLALRHVYSIDLDDDVRGERLHLEGQAVWHQVSSLVRTDDGQAIPIYRSGLAFRDDVTAAEKLRSYLETNAISARGDREPPRYHIRNRAPLMLATECPFDIHTISLAGMLVDVELLPAPGSSVDLMVDLPGGELEVRARVVGVFHPPREQPEIRTKLALRFEDLPPPLAARLREYLSRQIA